MGRLDVKIVAARNLPNNETFGEPDVFCELELENQQHKTSVEESVNPVWNEIFRFVIADEQSSQLQIKVWNKELVSDDLLGTYNLSLSGLIRGRVRDRWCLLQNCKGNAELRVRVIARDFGEDPPESDDPDPEPEPSQATFGARPKPLPPRLAQQGVQHNVQVAQQPFPQQQQQMMPFQQQQSNTMMNNQQYNMQQQQQNQMMMGQQQQQSTFRAGPDQTVKDNELFQFRGLPLCATYTPNDQVDQLDFTMQCVQAFQRGQMQARFHDLIGSDPKFGVVKSGRIWYEPSESYRDGETVNLKCNFPNELIKATYGPEGQPQDVTQQLRNLIQQGQKQIYGGAHTALGDHFVGIPKRLHVFYRSGVGIPPHKLQALRQSFNTWDADNSGFLDRSEALAAFFSFFPGTSPQMIDQKIRQADTNGDGQLSFDEYARIAQNFM